jgi:PAS domain S-box-containing protein
MITETPNPRERRLGRVATWFVVAVAATFVQSRFPEALGPDSPYLGTFAIAFLAALSGRCQGVAAAIAGFAVSAAVLTRDPLSITLGALGMLAEATVVLALTSRGRPRLDRTTDVYELLGLAIASTACRTMVGMIGGWVVDHDPLSVGVANSAAALFSILVTAPFVLAWQGKFPEWNGRIWDLVETAGLVVVIGIGVAWMHRSYELLVQPTGPLIITAIGVLTFWISIRYELKGIATAIFGVICVMVLLSLISADYRPFTLTQISALQHHLVLFLMSLLIACSLLMAAISRSSRLQSHETLLLMAALRQKAEMTIALNHKLTIQSDLLREQSEQLLAQYGDLEDANRRMTTQQAWLDAVLANIPVGVYIVDRHGQRMTRSSSFNDIRGWDDELPSQAMDELSRTLNVLRPDGQAYPVDDWPIIRALRSGERIQNDIMKIRSATGELQWLSINAAPIRDANGEITGSVASSVDITELERARRVNEENEARVRFALQSAKAIVWEQDLQEGMTYRTMSIAEWLGNPLESEFDHFGLPIGPMHPDDRERVQAEFQEFTSRVGEFSSEYRLLRLDGGVIWVLTRGETIADKTGQPRRIVGVHFDITVQKETEAKLRFLESAIVHTRDAVVLLDAVVLPNAGRSVLYVNDAFCRMSGYSRSEVVGRSLNLLRGPESDPGTLKQIRGSLELGYSLQTEILNYRKNGTAYWAELTLEPIRDGEGRIQHWVMIQRDITDRRRGADALRRSEEMFRGIFENAWAGVSLTDPHGRYVSANPAFLAMLGIEENQLIGHSSQEFTMPDSWAKQEPIVRDFLVGRIDRYQLKKEYRRPDGQKFWGELFCNAIRGPGGEFLYGLGVTVDVTERTRLENQLRESEARLRAVYENSAAGVIVVDNHAVILEVNPAFARMVGREPHELVGLPDSQITHPDDIGTERVKIQELMDGRIDNAQIRKRYLRTDGGTAIADLYTRCIRDDAGRVRFRIGVTIDMTERLALEDQLRQAQKMEAVGQMAGGIAHDFNNLLTAIIGNLSLVRRSNTDDILPLVNSAEQAAGRAADLTRKLLGFARRSQLQLIPVDARQVIREVVDILRRTLNPLIVIDTDISDCAPFRADSTLLNQVLVNLCLNGRDAMPNGGRLTLAAAEIEHESPPGGLLPGRFINLSVTDTGEGMSPETKARIFEPFFTTKGVGKGTGLGLAMVMGTIQQHGGWVDCTSDPGIGTRFDLYLPAAHVVKFEMPSESLRETPPTLAAPQPRSAEELVLIVDDEPLVRTLARAILETEGYRVAECEDGLEAIDWVREHPGLASLIVMDVTMPRMSGRDAYEHITALDPTARVIFSSGYSAEDMSDVISEVGMLAKPYRPADLLRTVRNAIDRTSLA